MQASFRHQARLLLLGIAWGWPMVSVAQEAACPKDVAGFRIMRGISLVGMRAIGGDPPGLTMGSLDRCAVACKARRDCVAFTMVNSATGHCFHYSSGVEQRPNAGYLSGVR